MPFVHSLVKVKRNERIGWRAPAELGESAPHYISFVIPLDERNRLLDEYTCEAVRVKPARSRTLLPYTMTKQGKEAFVLAIKETELWFFVRTVPKQERVLRYLGKLEHPDFRFSLTEIEPEEPAQLDALCAATGTFLIGCDAFTHYAGMAKLTSSEPRKIKSRS